MHTSAIYRRITLPLFILWGTLSLSGMEVAPDLRKIEPLALASGDPAVVATQQKTMGAPGRLPSSFPVFLHMRSDDRAFPGKIEALGGRAARVHPRLFSGAIPIGAARYISRWPEVAYIEAAKRAWPMLDLSRGAVFADIVHAGTGLPGPYDGTGTYVGIVDTGMSAGHPDFSVGGDPAFPRVVHWYRNPGTAGIDTAWHGTHVAGIAAGNGFRSGGQYAGMAPGAGILVAKTTFTTTDIQNSVSNLLAFAGTTPVAVNLSLGTTIGPHDGSSGFESAISSLATDGVSPGGKQVVTVAAGNEREGREHFQTAISAFGTATASLTLEPGGSQVDIWADAGDRYTVTATVGLESVSAVDGTSAASARISVFNRTDSPPNGATHITVFFTVTSRVTAAIRFDRTRNGGSGALDAYVDNFDGVFAAPTETGTITEPANAAGVISTGSFNTRRSNGTPAPEAISPFSSLGPTRDGRIKPDLAAPGSYIYSAKSLDLFLDPPPEPQEVPGNDNYVILQGTSMAAPHVAGIAALAWQANPALTSAQIRERLRRTATSVPPTPNTTWGYGKINALSAVSASVASITAPNTAAPGTVVALSSENSSGAFGNPLSYAWAFTSRPTGSGATLSSPAADNTSFTPDVPGDYAVALTVTQASPAGTPPGTAEAVIRVNDMPVAQIAGPASDNTGVPVPFSGTSSFDPDGAPVAFRWVLVSRPAGSSGSIAPADADNTTLSTDLPGTYVVGLRVNDGLDDSDLETKTFTATAGGAPPASTGGGGGGGCTVGYARDAGSGAARSADILVLLLPLAYLAGRKSVQSVRPAR